MLWFSADDNTGQPPEEPDDSQPQARRNGKGSKGKGKLVVNEKGSKGKGKLAASEKGSKGKGKLVVNEASKKVSKRTKNKGKRIYKEGQRIYKEQVGTKSSLFTACNHFYNN